MNDVSKEDWSDIEKERKNAIEYKFFMYNKIITLFFINFDTHSYEKCIIYTYKYEF